MTALLEARNLRGLPGGPFALLLNSGECLVISGPSGTGKSLFLRMLADLDENEGEVYLAGRKRESMPAPAWRAQVMYVPAESGWWGELVRDHMQPAEAALALMPRLGLRADLMDAPVSQLSSGERQRLAFIRAVIRKPAVLLLDEPSGALDPASTAQLETIIGELRARGTGFIIVSHDEAQAERIATRRCRMTPGTLTEIMP
jgi:putative ABC transport system ATP-binding protein